MDETKYTLIEHLTELRGRIVKSLLGVGLTTFACLGFAPQIFDYAIRPLSDLLADQHRVETLVVHPKPAPLVDALEDLAEVHLRATLPDVKTAVPRLEAEQRSRRPIDLVLVDLRLLAHSGAVDEALATLTPQPTVVYLATTATAAGVADLLLDGATVVRQPVRPAILARLVRQAAGAAGKSTASGRMVVLSPLEPFIAYLKIALVCGLFLACPIWLYQVWRFVEPGLYGHEKAFVGPTIVSGSLLFVGGGAFAYYLMFPMMFDVMVNQLMPQNLTTSFTVDNYLSLLLQMTVAFGAVFELPLVITLLAAAGLVRSAWLRRMRRYWIVLAFVLGAVLTPADPMSQLFMAIPLVLFYEVGLFGAVIFERRRARAAAAAAAEG